MGWWSTNEAGESFAVNDGDEMLWGDGPADVIGVAVRDVRKEFRANVGRNPTKREVLAGLLFSLGNLDNDWSEEPNDLALLFGHNPDRLRKPAEWCTILGMRVMDPDGWRRRDDETTWDTPITLSQFKERAGLSTVWYDPKEKKS